MGLIAITWAVFGQTLGHEFVDYDDNVYVYENPHAIQGVTISNLGWAFTHFEANNWHPLTTISHMIDCQLFGLKPGGHHLTNLLLHSVSVVLLFSVLTSATGAVWRSGLVAALFAIHPLHVESVAWVAERKDVLSGVFFMLALAAYFYYGRKPSVFRYGGVLILFAFSLMAKPMLVTMPIVLLLLDYWPLQRFVSSRKVTVKLVGEKIPFLLLALASGIITLFAQGKTVVPLLQLPVRWRIANAITSYVIYIRQMIWPARLALFYPFPERFPLWHVIVAAALLVGFTVCAFVCRKRHPYLITGWGWYLVMLLPVIGLIQVSSQSHADRYTYLPQIGLYLIITWAIAELLSSWSNHRAILAAVGAIIVIVFAWVAGLQASYWHDTERIWKRTLEVTMPRNDIAHLFLGKFLLQQRRFDEAIPEFRTFLARNPKDADAHSDLASALTGKGEMKEAIAEYDRALKLDPTNSKAETTLANFLLEHEQSAEAIAHYRNVLRQHPGSALAHYNLAVGLHRTGNLAEAITNYKEALVIEPGYPDAEFFLGQALMQNGQRDEAELHLKKD